MEGHKSVELMPEMLELYTRCGPVAQLTAPRSCEAASRRVIRQGAGPPPRLANL